MNKRYHFIYKTTNVITNKFYIGMHSTDDLDDGYLGSGNYLMNSINKHGMDNHHRQILEFHTDRKTLATGYVKLFYDRIKLNDRGNEADNTILELMLSKPTK